ncbi:MAG: hypothetical protein HC824_11235 [Synechococcales cyanobacterium RM1_1_8]|nr:hypothetical protein [Synechococcales cyanobacterium RM1_1_8]
MERQSEKLVMMAEDELTQYSTDARKIEKLRRKIGISIPPAKQQAIRKEILAEMPTDPIRKAIENNRQTFALPFWGIAGLGLLFGISFHQYQDFIATIAGGAMAIYLQKLGWRLQAQRLVIRTIDDIENRMKNPDAE